MKKALKTALFFTLALLPFTNSNAQDLSNSALVKVDSVFTANHSPNSPGGTMAVLKNGQVVLKKTTGMANLEHNIPITDSTVFNIASNSKQFTTYLAFMLQEKGKLSLEDDIRNFLPELKHLSKKITVKQLTNHAHGLPNVDEIAILRGENQLTHDEVVEMLFDINSFNFNPGEDYVYGNTGYVLLAEIIERVGGKPFDEQLKEQIFSKVGMNNAQAVRNYDKVIPNKAYSYQNSSGGFRANPTLWSTMGASGIYASINDLIAWAKNFPETKIGKQQYLEEMKQPTVLNSGKVIEYGMGIQFENYKGIDIVFHGGGTEGYRSYILYAPKYNLSLIYQANGGGFAGLDVIYNSLEILLKDYIKPELKTNYSSSDLKNFEGTYELNPGAYFTVFTEKDSLFFKETGTKGALFLPRINEDTFDFTGLPHAKLIFHENRFDLRFADFTYPARRVTPPNPTVAVDLSEYAGTYQNAEFKVTYNLILVNDELVARNLSHDDVSLTVYDETSLYAKSSFMGKLEFIIDDSSTNITGFRLHRQNLKNALFTKI